MRRVLCGLSIIALLCLVPARAAWAQAGEQGSLTGTVTDAQGGALPGVTAAAVNLQTNVTTTAVTNASGVYLLTPHGERALQGDVHAARLQHRGA